MYRWTIFLLLCAGAHALEVQGHRGARARRPENTMPAFEYAEAHGADVLELDLNVSKDGVLVISHDPFLNPEHCSNEKPVMIHDLTFNEIETYDCGAKKNARFPEQVPVPGTKMPSFRQFLDWAKPKKIRINAETKIFPAHPDWSPEPKEFAKLVLREVKKAQILGRTTIESFDQRTLIALKKIEPKIKTALLTSDNHLDFVAAVLSARADVLSPHADWILAEDVKALHAKHIQVLPWTVNDPGDWKRLIAMGVDGIITDDPEALKEFLKGDGH